MIRFTSFFINLALASEKKLPQILKPALHKHMFQKRMLILLALSSKIFICVIRMSSVTITTLEPFLSLHLRLQLFFKLHPKFIILFFSLICSHQFPALAPSLQTAAPGHKRKSLFALFLIQELTDSYDWLASLWRTAEWAHAPPTAWGFSLLPSSCSHCYKHCITSLSFLKLIRPKKAACALFLSSHPSPWCSFLVSLTNLTNQLPVFLFKPQLVEITVRQSAVAAT